MEHRERRNVRRAVWGVLLIALGLIFFLGQIGLVRVVGLSRWWPAFVVAIGIVRMITPDTRRQFVGGLGTVLFGLWFFACTWNWYGMTWSNSWPLTLVFVGAQTLLLVALDRLDIGPAGEEGRHA